MSDEITYVEQVVTAWEESYKKGLLTFWVLLALANGDKHMQQIKQYIEEDVRTNMTVDEKSLYRSISRFKKMDLITSRSIPSDNGGPAYKEYALTETGKRSLREFTDRNITNIFLTDAFRHQIRRI